jgi:molecular chaperone GrpE (heat shock protein)
MSEAIKVLQLRWHEKKQNLYLELENKKNFVAKEMLDDIVIIHQEIIKHFCNVIDNVEAELIQTSNTSKYLNEATAKLKDDIYG